MSEYKHILAASDLNHECLPVIKKAATFVKMFDAKLSVINVMPSIPYYMASGLSSVADIESEIEDEARQKVEDALSEAGINADIYISGGVAKTEIIKFAKKLEADLIVVGSHGSHGIKGLLGETATGVLHKAKCDVFVVRVK
jgi:universal stress protein A